MLEHTFLFLPRIGARTEARLWDRGVLTWDDYREAEPKVIRGVGDVLKRQHDRLLDEAEQALRTQDLVHFARTIPSVDAWRCWDHFRERAVYLDIETADVGMTVFGYKPEGEPAKALVRDDDLTREAVGEALADATMLVTFNGASFDLPVLRHHGVDVPEVPHLDLRHALRRLGYTGGLKRIEAELGIGRDDDLDGVSGYEAILLWEAHAARTDPTALDKLVRYNIADVENLAPLAGFACDALREETLPKRVTHPCF